MLQNSHLVLAVQHVRLRKTDQASCGSIGSTGPSGSHLLPVGFGRKARRPPFAKLRFDSIPGEVKAIASRWTVYLLIDGDQLSPVRIGRSVRFTVEQLDQFVAERALAF